MQLKYIEMQGFKSFPDKTRINVSPGMTVVVGPNGSGKSNISDAIRWVLGELSSKNMRGNKMEDVIFGGCDSRRPMGFAEVSLTFDNTKGEIPLNVPYDEVCVTRKYYRTGVSEYMINRKTVRLRDITDLFMNTGLGKSGYSIIGQGRIAEIISKKSEERRGIFEEAAGISKYRARKNEAERKLVEVELNLSTAEILRNNLESQLGPLEKQSIKAKKYTALRDEKMHIDISLWLWEIDSVKSKAEELLRKYEIAQREYDAADDEVRSLETRSERLSELVRENYDKSDENKARIRQLTEEKHSHDNLASLMENDIKHVDENIERLKKDLQDIHLNGTRSVEITEALNEKLKDAQEKLNELKALFLRSETALGDIRAEIAKNDGAIENYSELIEEKNDSLVATKLELSSLKASKGGNDDKNQDIKKQIEEEREKLAENTAKEKQLTLSLREHKERYDAIAGKISVLAGERSALSTKLRSIDESKRSALSELSVTEGKMENLRRMEAHFEGLASSVKLVMEWSARGFLEGICGPLSSIISIDPEYVVAFESTLGSTLQNIVCESDKAAKAAIGKLKAERAGVATFYPLNTVRPSPLNVDLNKLKKCEGYIGIAAELVKCDSKYNKVIQFLLGRTVVCTNIDCAGAIGREFDYRFRIVTLDGQLVNAGGSFTGGSHKQQSSGLLSRRSEIESLAKKVEQLRNRISVFDRDYADMFKKIEDANDDISFLESDLEIADGLMRNAEFEVKLVSERNQDIKNGIAHLISELDEIAKMQDISLKKIEDSQKLISRLDSEIASFKTKLSEEKQTRALNEEKRSQIIDEKNALDSKISATSSSIEYLNRELQATNERAISLGITEKEDMRMLEEQKDKKTSLVEKIKNEKERSEKITLLIAEIDKESLELKSVALEYETELARLRGQIKEKSTHKENCMQSLTRAKQQAEFVNTEQDKYLSLLWDEYDLTYAAAEEIPHEKITPENKPSFVTQQNRLKRSMKELGDVNLASIEEFATKKAEFEELDRQYTDLVKSKEEYLGIVKNMERQMKSMFVQTFNKINENFTVVFSELFGGGRGELSLTDPENVLESGIEISVAPPGKIIKSLSLLSGGEQVFVAIALFFAILRVTPAPFCLLDEIEAALDEVNVKRFATYAKKFSDKTQFIIISHRRGTMELADTLYGVAMQERGISGVLSIEVNEVEEKLGLKDIK